MRRLSATFVLVCIVLLVATGGGVSVADAEGGAGASATGVKVMVGEESAGRARVLIIGDSVFDAFDHVESA
ncbi:MAG: hypothetical protein ACO3Q6_07945, partial [Ilumatobacteraceae bacterium]